MRSRRRIHWPDPSKGQDFDLRLELVGLPYEEGARAHPLPAILLLALAAAAWVGAAFVLGSRDMEGAASVAELLFWVGVAFTVGALFYLRSRRLRLTPDEVSWKAFRVLPWPRRTNWVEPVRAYTGILRTVRDGEGDKDGIVLHELSLHHPDDEAKCVKLYSSSRETDLINRQKRLARLFGLAALVETEDGAEAIALKDLDKPLRQRAREGTVAAGVSPGAPPWRLRLSVKSQAMTMQGRRLPHPGILFGGLLLAGIGVSTLLVWPHAYGKFLALSFSVIGLGIGLARVLIVQVLCVGPDRVETWHALGPLRFGRLAMGADEVREVTVGKARVHPLFRALRLPKRTGLPTPVAVNITGEREAMAFGHVLSREARTWARDCIEAVLASG